MRSTFHNAIAYSTAFAVAGLLSAGTANAATSYSLTAHKATATLTAGASVPMWGYCTTGSAACAAGWQPGPTLVAPAGEEPGLD